MSTTASTGPPGPGGPTEPTGSTEPPATADATDELRVLVRRGRILTLVVLGVVVVLVVAAAAFGGFQRRDDEISPAEAGQELTTGPYVLTFTSGTVQHIRSDGTWRVVVSGTARTTEDTSDTIPAGSGTSAFVYGQDVGTRRVQVVGDWSYGPAATPGTRPHRYLVPGAGPVEARATFTFTAQPQGKLRLVVLDQEYGKAYVFGDEEAWRPARTGHDVPIPLEVLPDAKY